MLPEACSGNSVDSDEKLFCLLPAFMQIGFICGSPVMRSI